MKKIHCRCGGRSSLSIGAHYGSGAGAAIGFQCSSPGTNEMRSCLDSPAGMSGIRAGVQMRVTVKVKPGSSRPGIEEAPGGGLLIRVREAAREGKANAAVIEALSEKFSVPKTRIRLLRGETGRTKVFEID